MRGFKINLRIHTYHLKKKLYTLDSVNSYHYLSWSKPRFGWIQVLAYLSLKIGKKISNGEYSNLFSDTDILDIDTVIQDN